MKKSPTDSFEVDVRVMPRASLRKIEWVDAVSLKIWVTEAPVDGQANSAIIDLLAKAFRIPKRDIEIIRGETSRGKRIRISGISLDEAHARLP